MQAHSLLVYRYKQLTGFSLQDINIRLHKHPQVNHRTIVQNDYQWKLHQVLRSSMLPQVSAITNLTDIIVDFRLLQPPGIRFKHTRHAASQIQRQHTQV